MGFDKEKRATRVSISEMFASMEEFLAHYAVNISRTGVFIKTETPFPVGTRVNFRFSIVIDEIETVTGVGDVVRSNPEPGEEQGMALSFVELEPRSREMINQILEMGKQ